MTRQNSAVQQKPAAKSAFVDVESMEWIPWVMDDTWFKLLGINPISGGFTLMLKVGPNNHAPVHGHIGMVEAYIIEGGMAYGDDIGRKGDYMLEPGGINHEPHTMEEGMILFGVAHGPLVGYEDDGGIAAVVDAKMMYEMAAAAGQAGHIERPVDWD